MDSFFDYRDIDLEELQEHFHIGEFTEGDNNSRQTKTIPTFHGKKLRFNTPWMFSRFGWGGKYNTLTVQSYSKGKFPFEKSSEKKQFRHFLEHVGSVVEKHVVDQPNPNNLNLALSKPFNYDNDYNYYKYYFNIPKRHFDSEGEFEGKVVKSTNVDDPELIDSSIKAIEPNSYVQLVGYIGKITQTKNAIRFNIVVQQIHWFPGNTFVEQTEKETIASNTNFFLNIPTTTRKRKVNVKVDYLEDEDVEDLSSSKKVKIGTE